MNTLPHPDRRAAVIGGGIIGLGVSRTLAGDGWTVTVFDKGAPGQEASSAAAGLLAPRLEFEPGSRLIEPALASLRLYPAFAKELEDETGVPVDLRLDGIIAPIIPGEATPSPPGAVLVRGPELRDIEPALHPALEAAHYFAGEGSVDSRGLVRAALESCRRRGVRVIPNAAVEEVAVSGGRVLGLRAGGHFHEADIVINCAGAWAGEVRVTGGAVRIRPIKGQMALLRRDDPFRGAPRVPVYTREAYVVPRKDGRVIVGTTVEDCGFEKAVEPATVARLVGAAIRLCPSLSSAGMVESWAGLRPRGEEETPRIGPHGPAGYWLAVGHYRNGILLAPLTAALLAGQVRSPAPAGAARAGG